MNSIHLLLTIESNQVSKFLTVSALLYKIDDNCKAKRLFILAHCKFPLCDVVFGRIVIAFVASRICVSWLK